MMPTVLFPDVLMGEWNALSTSTATGLFAYRQMQAMNLLELPDYGGGDMTAEERRVALRGAVNFQKPLAALSIFLGVVAIEDFVRDFGARMADEGLITQYFPNLVKLRAQPIVRPPDQAFKRLDKDPIGSVDPQLINELFEKSLGIQPISADEYPRLRDLALIRHTVAHHAAVIRPIDVSRFQHYIVRPYQLINPPVEFVRETVMYLYKTGRVIEEAVRHRVFSVILPSLESDWSITRPAQLIQLIEFFNYFGFIETADGPIGYVEPGTPQYESMQLDAAQIKKKLTVRCIQELQKSFPA